MCTKIVTLAGAAFIGLFALTGLQASAQASEFRHEKPWFEHRDRHYHHPDFRFFLFDHHRGHDRRW